MTSNKNFKQALMAGKLNEALVIAMSQAPELKITTSIVSSSTSETDNGSSSKPLSTKRLHTRINLVEGEIYNEISEDLIGNIECQEVQQFHFEQVARGHQIIQKNLESLQNIFHLMTTVQQQQLAGNYHTDVKYLQANTSTLTSNLQTPLDEENGINQAESNLLDKVKDIDESSDLVLDEASEPKPNSIDDSQAIAEAQKDEDWGEWLEEEENPQDIDVDLLDLSSLELDDSEEWQDWEGEETQFFTGEPASVAKEDQKPKSQG